MSEEAEVVAEQPEVTPVESSEPSFDMEKAQDTISEALFDKKEEEVEEIDEELDLSQEDDKEIKKEAKKEEVDEKDKIEDVDKELKKELSKKEAPQSWKKEMREFFNSSDPVMQDYILQRENQMHEGLEKDRGDANLGRSMRDMLQPYDQMFQNRGIDGPQAVKYLLQNHERLSSGTPEQKVALLQQLARSYGITAPIEGGEQKEVDPQVQGLTQRLANIEQNLNANQQAAIQETKTRINTEVSAFADEHPLFDELSDDIASMIRGTGCTLEEAYEKAKWSNPVVRQKELDRLESERIKTLETEQKKEAEAAKKAKSVNVRGRDTKKAPTAKLGTMEDTMRDTFREIKSRN